MSQRTNNQENRARQPISDYQQEGRWVSMLTLIGLVFLMSINSLLWKDVKNNPQEAMNSGTQFYQALRQQSDRKNAARITYLISIV